MLGRARQIGSPGIASFLWTVQARQANLALEPNVPSLSAHTATWNLCQLVLLLGLLAIPHADGVLCSHHELSHDAMLPPKLPFLSVPPDVAIAHHAPCHRLLAARSCLCLQFGCAHACCWCPMHPMCAQTMCQFLCFGGIEPTRISGECSRGMDPTHWDLRPNISKYGSDPPQLPWTL